MNKTGRKIDTFVLGSGNGGTSYIYRCDVVGAAACENDCSDDDGGLV